MDWFKVSFDGESITLTKRRADLPKLVQSIPWFRIIRICFLAGDYIRSDELYIFTDERPESYVIPMDASGALLLWNEMISRGLFDAKLAIKAASSLIDTLLCWPPEEDV